MHSEENRQRLTNKSGLVDNFSRFERGRYCFPVYIYILSDSSGVRYVGQSSDPSTRFSAQKCQARSGRDSTPRGEWIKSLLDIDQEPGIEIIEACHPKIANERERHWINHYFWLRDSGLLNTCKTAGKARKLLARLTND
jgi:hypothetical protein